MVEIIIAIMSLVTNGAGALAKMKKEEREKLKRVYLEVLQNKKAMELSGYADISPLTSDNKTFISLAKVLKNTEIKPFFKFNSKGLFFSNSRKAAARRRTQYAINYVITQIDDLKNIVSLKRADKAFSLILKRRLNTLYKHLNTLEKVLSPLGKKK
jgi:hypothetical protein